MHRKNWAKLASAYGGVMFGLFWIPLRVLDQAGFPGVWASVVFIAAPVVVLAPFLLWRARRPMRGGLRFHAAGICVGTAFALYASAFVYTDIVRTVLLFYLTPIWGFLLARIVIGEQITTVRWLSIFLGILGLFAILGTDAGLPIPRNVGDWMALSSGVIWAAGSLLLLLDNKTENSDRAFAFFFWGAIVATGLALFISAQGLNPYPDWPAIGQTLWWLVPVTVLLTVPTGFAVVFGPSELNPGVAGLLFMTEIIVATMTATFLAGEAFGVNEALGVTLICTAALLEPLAELRASRTPGRRSDCAKVSKAQ